MKNLTNQVSRGRRAAVKTFTRINNLSIEPRTERQAKTLSVATNRGSVACSKHAPIYTSTSVRQPRSLFSTKPKAPLVLFATVLTALLLSATPALAAKSRVFGGSFGSAGSAAGELSLVSLGEHGGGAGLAVNDESSSASYRDVYVADTGNHRVEEFSSSGVFIRAWGWGVDKKEPKAELQTCTEVTGCQAGISGTHPGQFEAPAFIAVDDSPGGGGDVYVADYAEFGSADNLVQKFTAEGALVEAWGVDGQVGESALPEPEHLFDISGVAVQPSGDLLVGSSNGLFAFSQASGAYLAKVAHGTNSPSGVAVNGPGDIYFSEGAAVFELDSGGNELGGVFETAAKTPPTGVAVDPATGELYVDEGAAIASIASACTPRSSPPFCAASTVFGSPQLGGGAGLAVDSSSDTVYAADTSADRVDSFILEPAAAPRAGGESVAEVTGSSASLGAEIDPRSEPGEAATEYHFVYGACTAAGGCAESGYPSSAPGVEGQLSPGFEARAVSVPVQGLTPGTTYHFKVVAHNALGPVEGTEATFTTQGPGGELVLPDDRGWELVSPPDKQGAAIEPISEESVVQAAADGGGITYLANAPTEAQPQGAANLSQVLSSRSASGWSSRDISLPHVSATDSLFGQGPEYKFFSPDLSLSAVQPYGQFNPLLSEAASESTAYLHDLTISAGACTPASSCYVPLVTRANDTADPFQPFGEDELCTPQAGVETTGTLRICGPQFVGASQDLAHIVLRSSVALKPGAGANQLYEWTGGALASVSLLPGGAPASEPSLGFGKGERTQNAISSDGSRIVWEAAPNLYQRDTTREETVQLDQAEGCVGCTSGGGEFQLASADGSRVFFTDTHRLTSDSGAVSTGSNHQADLYECQIAVVANILTCALHDLTPKHGEGEEAASVLGRVLGASADGEYLYFVADGVQSGANTQGKSPEPGKPNLYERHGDTTSFITTLSAGDSHDWGEEVGAAARQPTRVSPNGRYLELMSQAPLTGYDNRDATSDQPTAEVYLYDAVADKLECASCDPTGARPTGVEYQKLEPGSGGLVGGPRGIWPVSALVAANVPGTTEIAVGEQRYQPRYLNDDDRLFFDTVNALVSQDSNNTQDVYEYERAGGIGSDSCTSASETFSTRSGGCVNLISSGRSSRESAFLDASESGDDVFFLTAARLSKLDTDNALDVYDAHVCSDSPCIAPPASSAAQCEAETSCRAPSPPQPSPFSLPTSATFAGTGNLAPSTPVPVVKRSLTRAQKLAKALKACHAKTKRKKRASCEKASLKKYGPLKKAKRRKK